MLKTLELTITNAWENQAGWLKCLKPFSFLFGLGVRLRQLYYQFSKPKPLSVPVIVIGNITMGGSGKTPVVIELVKHLQRAGFHPAVVSRGFRGALNRAPTLVTESHKPQEVGDEALLIYLKTGVPVMVGRDRRAAAEALIEGHTDIDVILSDDGLQHYALPRLREVTIIEPSLFKQKLFPEGSLREPLSRLKSVDYLLVKNQSSERIQRSFTLTTENPEAYDLVDPTRKVRLKMFAGLTVHAIAGIGRPSNFFRVLRELGIDVIEHPFPDHHTLTPEDCDFNDGLPILMTEKDAIKCDWAQERATIWVVPLKIELEDRFVMKLIQDLKRGQKAA